MSEPTPIARPTLPTPESRRPLTVVELPRWGLTLYVREMSAGQRASLPDDTVAFMAEVLVRSVVHEDGTPVWQSTEAELPLAYPMEDLQPLIDAALEVNALTPKAAEAAKGN